MQIQLLTTQDISAKLVSNLVKSVPKLFPSEIQFLDPTYYHLGKEAFDNPNYYFIDFLGEFVPVTERIISGYANPNLDTLILMSRPYNENCFNIVGYGYAGRQIPAGSCDFIQGKAMVKIALTSGFKKNLLVTCHELYHALLGPTEGGFYTSKDEVIIPPGHCNNHIAGKRCIMNVPAETVEESPKDYLLKIENITLEMHLGFCDSCKGKLMDSIVKRE